MHECRMSITTLLNAFLLVIAKLIQVEGLPSDLVYVIPLNEDHRQQWVDSHNHFRRQVTNPEAANMRLITWDDELAALAESVVEKCTFQHTASNDLQTSVFQHAGENLYAGSNHRIEDLMTTGGVSNDWFNEVDFYNYTTGGCQSGEQCGHYTQIAWADTYKVGCAIARCRTITYGHGNELVSCNYGPAGNLYYADGTPFKPYISGEACSQCGEGDLCIDQLCNNTNRDVPFTTTTTTASTTTVDLTTTVQESTTTSSEGNNVPFTTTTTMGTTTTVEPTTVQKLITPSVVDTTPSEGNVPSTTMDIATTVVVTFQQSSTTSVVDTTPSEGNGISFTTTTTTTTVKPTTAVQLSTTTSVVDITLGKGNDVLNTTTTTMDTTTPDKLTTAQESSTSSVVYTTLSDRVGSISSTTPCADNSTCNNIESTTSGAQRHHVLNKIALLFYLFLIFVADKFCIF